jgi:hypothetical protein
VRFHDLRHTFASHLVSGSWGPAWTLKELAEMMGHRSTRTTERYAHLATHHLAAKAAQTARGRATGPQMAQPADHNNMPAVGGRCKIRTCDLWLRSSSSVDAWSTGGSADAGPFQDHQRTAALRLLNQLASGQAPNAELFVLLDIDPQDRFADRKALERARAILMAGPADRQAGDKPG